MQAHEKYQILDEITHIKKRLNIYAGSNTLSKHRDFIINEQNKLELRELEYTPALIKLVSEIIDNSIDEHNRNGNVNVVRVNYNALSHQIIVEDNGGIPVVMHPDVNMYVPSMVFGLLRTSSNYNDSEQTSLAGTNGVGSTLTKICSNRFEVITADGNKQLTHIWDNINNTEDVVVIDSEKNFTKITFDLDFDLLKTNPDVHTDWIYYIKFYLYFLAINNPKCKIYFNDKIIEANSLDKLIKINNYEGFVCRNAFWNLAVIKNDDLGTLAFCNGLYNKDGGTHVDLFNNTIYPLIIAKIKKQYKISVRPSVLKSYFSLILCAKIIKPEFESQTKSKLVTASDKFIKTFENLIPSIVENFMNSDFISSVIESIIDSNNERDMKDIKKLEKATKSALRSILKFNDCASKNFNDRTLFLTEGDSAKGTIMNVRDANTMAVFPLKGRPVSGYILSYKELLENEEFNNIIKIVSFNEYQNFSKIIIASDADEFGYGICGSLIASLIKHVPQIRDRLYRLNTPQIIVTQGKNIIEFFNQEDFKEWTNKNTNKKYTYKYYKGLGSFNRNDFKKYVGDAYLLKFEESEGDKDMFELCFSKKEGFTDKRKDWLAIN